MAGSRAHGGLEADEAHMGGRTQCSRRGALKRQGIGLRGAQRGARVRGARAGGESLSTQRVGERREARARCNADG